MKSDPATDMDWKGKYLCFECSKKLGANINIGFQSKGRCQRCHSEQTVFRVKETPTLIPPGESGTCPECAHPSGTHAASCSRCETEQMRRERQEIVAAMEETVGYDPGQPLEAQVRKALARLRRIPSQDHESGASPTEGQPSDGSESHHSPRPKPAQREE